MNKWPLPPEGLTPYTPETWDIDPFKGRHSPNKVLATFHQLAELGSKAADYEVAMNSAIDQRNLAEQERDALLSSNDQLGRELTDAHTNLETALARIKELGEALSTAQKGEEDALKGFTAALEKVKDRNAELDRMWNVCNLVGNGIWRLREAHKRDGNDQAAKDAAHAFNVYREYAIEVRKRLSVPLPENIVDSNK